MGPQVLSSRGDLGLLEFEEELPAGLWRVMETIDRDLHAAKALSAAVEVSACATANEL